MSTNQRATKKKTGRVTKQPARPRKKAVSAIQARRLAARHVMARMFDDVPVRDGAEMKGSVYHMRSGHVWLVFPNSGTETSAIRPSTLSGPSYQTMRSPSACARASATRTSRGTGRPRGRGGRSPKALLPLAMRLRKASSAALHSW